MSNCPSCNNDWSYCQCSKEKIQQAYDDQDFWFRTKDLTIEDIKRIRNKI